MTIPTPRSSQRGNSVVEHVLLEQRVAHRQQEEVHVEQIEEARDRAHRIEARADAADDARLAQFRKRLPPARLELREIGVERRGIVIPGVEIVDQEDVDPIDSEPLRLSSNERITPS